MQQDVQIWGVVIGVFVAVAALTALVGFQVERARRVQVRLFGGLPESKGASRDSATKRLVDRLDDEVLGIADPKRRSKLRMALVRAGYFSPDAPRIFVLVQAVLVVGVPILGYLVSNLVRPIGSAPMQALFLAALMAAGYYAPNIYLRRRQGGMRTAYRIAFPDLLDLLVVCVDAGLSLNAALDRVSAEFAEQSRELATNLGILLSEMRSGRGVGEALDGLSDRLDIDEVRSFSTLIKQSIELGSDVSEGMRVFSEEMRVKRLMRAEEMANKLPVKMLVPLGFFIFPVILMVVLTPALIQVLGALKHLISRG